MHVFRMHFKWIMCTLTIFNVIESYAIVHGHACLRDFVYILYIYIYICIYIYTYTV